MMGNAELVSLRIMKRRKMIVLRREIKKNLFRMIPRGKSPWLTWRIMRV